MRKQSLWLLPLLVGTSLSLASTPGFCGEGEIAPAFPDTRPCPSPDKAMDNDTFLRWAECEAAKINSPHSTQTRTPKTDKDLPMSDSAAQARDLPSKSLSKSDGLKAT